MGIGEMNRDRRLRALTTGEAARCCFVTPETIANWIKAGLLPAQRTAGRQYRILVSDLRTFMSSQGMSTELLDDEPEGRQLCWEFQSVNHGAKHGSGPCDGCLVKSLGVLNCFKLMGMHPGDGHLHENCEDCAYFQRWGCTPVDDNKTRNMWEGK